MGNAPDTVKRLVDHFDQNHAAYHSVSYNEAQLRREWCLSALLRIIDPLFEALGWDVDSKRCGDPVHRWSVGGRWQSPSL